MTEIELKLQIPATSLAAVERELGRGATRRVRLQAVYFDTADRRLAAAGLALRLRKEGRRWVQTLKSGSAHGIERGEHDVARRLPAGLEPTPDLALHAGTRPGERLAEVLAATADAAAAGLLPLYRTDVWRRQRLLRSRRGVVEMALDRGEIVATGPDGVARRWPLRELEVELKSGSPLAVTDVAARWAARHGLWLDTRGKAERGDRLSRGLAPGDAVPAAKAQPLRWRKSLKPAEAWAALLANLLAQALPNWSEVAAGSPAAEPVHQLRVALRRLRSAERFVAGWPGVTPGAWGEAATALFRDLGAMRDREVLAGGPRRVVDAALAALGEPPLALPPTDATPWTDAERTRHGALLLQLQAAALDSGEAIEDAAELRRLAAARLADWHERLRKDARRFAALDDAARHRVRKRIKRLRYAVEFAAALFPKAAVEAYLVRLREAQERLGEFNDLCVALAAYRPLAATEPRAWFALGWLAARREAALGDCAAALGRWRKAEPFWP